MRKTLVRLVLAVAVTVAAISTLTFATAGSAVACSNNNNDHCYGEVDVDANIGNAIGMMSYETLNCRMQVPIYNFTTDEIWLAGTNSNTWIETGYMITYRGDVVGIPGSQFAAFWFKSVGGRYTGAVLKKDPATSGNFYVQPNHSINGYDVGFTSSLGYTHNHQISNNGLVPADLIYGSETTANSGVHTGFDGAPAWEDNGAGWHSGIATPWSIQGYYRQAPNRFTWQTDGHFNYTSGPAC